MSTYKQEKHETNKYLCISTIFTYWLVRFRWTVAKLISRPMKIKKYAEMSTEWNASLAFHHKRLICIRFSYLFITVSLGLLFYFGITVVLPSAQAGLFHETRCLVNFSVFDGEEVCDCGGGFSLSSCYPCLKIHVVFSTENISTGIKDTKSMEQSVLYKDVLNVGDKVGLSVIYKNSN